MRSTEEWIGATPDTAIPPRVKVRVLLKHDGYCAKCNRRLMIGKWDCDHITALANGGENRESNLQPLCISPCHSDKTKADVAEKSKVARVRAKHLGLRPARQKIASRGFQKSAPQRSATRPIERRT